MKQHEGGIQGCRKCAARRRRVSCKDYQFFIGEDMQWIWQSERDSTEMLAWVLVLEHICA